jgi:hypothetical protein
VNPQCLKHTRRWMDFECLLRDGFLDNCCELRCCCDWCLLSRADNPLGNPFSESFLTISPKNINKDIHCAIVDYLHSR